MTMANSEQTTTLLSKDGTEVRVILYRNPRGWVSVQVETDSEAAVDNLRVMLNDADLHEGHDVLKDEARGCL